MANKARILFVDDEKRVLNSMRGLFRRDYELFLTCEGAEAIQIAAENEIDVIVADQRMPGMTGVEVLAQMKKRSPRTVRILLTGYADPSAVEGSINMGEVFRFLSKPCPPKLLRETLSLAISASRTQPVAAAEPQPRPQAEPKPVSEPQPVPEPEPQPVATAKPQPEPPRPQPEATISDKEQTQPALQTLDVAAAETREESSDSHWHTVTNVVMSENSVEETQETVALSLPGPAVKDVGVVVFTIDSEFATTAIRAISREWDASLATSLGKVAQAITQQNAGVLVTDFTSNKATLQKIIGVLKKHRPELVTIVVSDGRDTTDMINLINYGQVFRYVLKPIEPAQLREEIMSAAIHHVNLLTNPESAKRHTVIDPVESGTTSKSISQFVGDIRTRHPARFDPSDTIS